jgi:hypothetical protein
VIATFTSSSVMPPEVMMVAFLDRMFMVMPFVISWGGLQMSREDSRCHYSQIVNTPSN